MVRSNRGRGAKRPNRGRGAQQARQPKRPRVERNYQEVENAVSTIVQQPPPKPVVSWVYSIQVANTHTWFVMFLLQC